MERGQGTPSGSGGDGSAVNSGLMSALTSQAIPPSTLTATFTASAQVPGIDMGNSVLYSVPWTITPTNTFSAGEVLNLLGTATLLVSTEILTTASVAVTAPGVAFTGIGQVNLIQSQTVMDGQTVSNPQSSSATTPLASKKDSLSTGAVAGIAIGTAIFGALLAFLICFLLNKRRDKRRRGVRTHGPVAVSRHSAEKGGFAAPAGPERLLPQPYDDSRIGHSVQNLFTHIDGHVESFYDTASAGIIENTEGLQNGYSGSLAHPSTRPFIMKRLIIESILESLSLECATDRSFLPYGYTSLARQLQSPASGDQRKYSKLAKSTNLTISISKYIALVQAPHLGRTSA